VATALAPLSQSAIMLISLRVLQGLGAAFYVTTGMAILSSVFPPEGRGKAIGIYVSAVYIGLSAGPWIGGILTHHFGWRSIFYVSVPMGIFCLFLTLSFLKGEWRGEPGQKLDLFASLLYAIAIIALVYGGSQLPSTFGFVTFLTGIGLGYVFVRHQLSAKFPVFDLRLFVGNRNFTFSSLAALLHYSATFAVTFLLSLYLQFIRGLSPQEAGMILMLQALMMALLSPFAGKLSDRIEARLLATLGMVMTCVGIFIFSLLSKDTSLYLIALNLIFLGIGFALFSSPNMSAIMGAVEKRYFGLASGAVATMRLLGQMSSMALATVVLGIIVGPQSLSAETGDLLLISIRIVLFCCSVMSLVGVYFSWYRGEGKK
jgi:MFS family permease